MLASVQKWSKIDHFIGGSRLRFEISKKLLFPFLNFCHSFIPPSYGGVHFFSCCKKVVCDWGLHQKGLQGLQGMPKTAVVAEIKGLDKQVQYVYFRYIAVGGVQVMVSRYKWERDISGVICVFSSKFSTYRQWIYWHLSKFDVAIIY